MEDCCKENKCGAPTETSTEVKTSAGKSAEKGDCENCNCKAEAAKEETGCCGGGCCG